MKMRVPNRRQGQETRAKNKGKKQDHQLRAKIEGNTGGQNRGKGQNRKLIFPHWVK